MKLYHSYRVGSCVLLAAWLGGARAAHAEQSTDASVQAAPTLPAYTLELESDAADVLSFETIAPALAAELGAAVDKPGAAPPSRAQVALRYRRADGSLSVRATQSSGITVDRSVRVGGTVAEVRRAAVLLAGNAARDEASEIASALSPKPVPVSPTAPAIESDGDVPAVIGFAYPVATNYGKPNITTSAEFSPIYGRVGAVRAMQFDGVMAHASRSVRGLQLGGAVAWSEGPIEGLQLGGALDFARGDVIGAQVAGALGYAEGVRGLQLAGAANIATKRVDGLQLSGAANLAMRGMEGLQLSGFNYAENVSGAQIGVLNIAGHVRGAQIGVLNIADKVDGAAIGIASVSKDSVHPVAWTSNLSYINAGVRFSTEYLYTVLAAGFGNPETQLKQHIALSAGLGAHLALPSSFDIEVEGLISYMSPNDTFAVPRSGPDRINSWVHSRALVGYTVMPRIRVFAGGGVRIPVSVDVGASEFKPEGVLGVQF